MNHVQEALRVLRESRGYERHTAAVDKARSVTDIAKTNNKVATLLLSAKKAAKQQLDHHEAMIKSAGELSAHLIKIHDELYELDQSASEKFWDSAPVDPLTMDARKSPENAIKLAKFIGSLR